MKDWLRHAFAVDATPAEIPTEQAAVVEKLCREIVRRELTTAATTFLEMSRPLNYIGAQTLHYFAPMISAIARGDDHRHFAAFLERRDAIDRIIERVEQLETERTGRRGPAKDGASSAADNSETSVS